MAWKDPKKKQQWYEKNKEKIKAYNKKYHYGMRPKIDETKINLTEGKGKIKRYEWDRT